ncbi:histidine kinase [Dactylosporangium sp. NPDC049525]|uniref:sensor histidine kinase n=1 Tax=Dactylosporangium sp. NPDC049525 TaxID=3154730 RepID=UPI00342483CA
MDGSQVLAVAPSARPWVSFGSVAGWVLCALTVCMTGAAAVFGLLDGVSPEGDLALDCALGLGSGLLGAFIVTRHPRHQVGWLFVCSGLLRAVAAAAEAWSHRALVTDPGSLPGGALASWLAWAFLPSVAAAPMIVVLFPDGRLPGPAWRVVPVLAGVIVTVYGVVVPLAIWPYRGPQLLPDAPAPDTTTGHAVTAAISAGALLAVVATLLALAAVVVRARRATGDVRQQMKWFGFGAACGLALSMAGLVPGLAWVRVLGPVAVLTGIGLGIFRFRLYDVDRLISRTLVYGSLTVTLLAAVAAVDITVALIAGQDSALVAAASAFAVALLLRPVRDLLQGLIDRLFDRRTYDAVRVLRQLSQQIGHDPVRPAAVRDALRKALRDPGLEVYLHARQPDVLVDPDGAVVDPPPDVEGRTTERVGRGTETIALIAHTVRDPRSVRPVLRAATPLLEHARLQAELSLQLIEVRASRARLALAADAERRRIERDLHDGAQQRLVGLALHIQSARRRGSYPPDIGELLGFTVEQLGAGVEDIRALVHGILPPALVTGGLPAAIADLARPDAVLVTCAVPDRPDPSIEATAWFVACEALANANKHAPGEPVQVDVSAHDGRLHVRITDHGPGGADPHGEGLRHLADRVEAHAGSLRVQSPAHGGTIVIAELPCAS